MGAFHWTFMALSWDFHGTSVAPQKPWCVYDFFMNVFGTCTSMAAVDVRLDRVSNDGYKSCRGLRIYSQALLWNSASCRRRVRALRSALRSLSLALSSNATTLNHCGAVTASRFGSNEHCRLSHCYSAEVYSNSRPHSRYTLVHHTSSPQPMKLFPKFRKYHLDSARAAY